MADDNVGMAYARAAQDFHEARRRADLERVLARLRGESVQLLSYEEVRQQLRANETRAQTLEDVPIAAIVGSVGRYTDFTRTFLPQHDQDEERWARVMLATKRLEGLPPVSLYKVGEAYFVRDGHHRISVARQLGATHVQSYVTEVMAKVPLEADASPDALILKAEYAAFLERTHLDTLRPQADLTLTAPGQYEALEEHIRVHRYFMGLEQQREIPYAEAVAHWYDEIYLPVVQVIRQRGLLRDFPERTEADLYLWVLEHREALQTALGWEIEPEAAASDLAEQHSARPGRVAARWGERVLDAVTPDALESGPAPGVWRKGRLSQRQEATLFADILVPLGTCPSDWRAFEQAVVIARREGGQLRGLHVVATPEAQSGPTALALQETFAARCREAGVAGTLAVEVGRVARKICERARWVDLVVLSLNHPPESQPLARLSSGLRTLLQRCPRPVLTVPRAATPLERLLLAYDGSAKAQEALFVAAYLAGCWGSTLTVLTVLEGETSSSEAPMHAWDYLKQQQVSAQWIQERGAVAEVLLAVAAQQPFDLILMGGYGFNALLEVVFGSTVDQVLRESPFPTLICR